MIEFLLNGPLKGINDRIPGNMDIRNPVLGSQLKSCLHGWGEMQIGDPADEFTVHFLRVRSVLIISSQACLHVSNWNL
ncbi:hypothetical protein D3C85_1757420 [compost metagenome]